MEYLNRHFFMGFIAGVVGTLLVIYIASSFMVRSMMNREKIEAALNPPVFPGVEAEYRWSLATLEGEEIPFSTFRDRVVFLNFWSVSCVPCTVEFSSLNALAEEYEGRGVEFIHICVDEADDVRKFMEENPLLFEVYVTAGEVPEVFLSGMVSSKTIIDDDGKIACSWLGPARWDVERTRDFLDRLI
jgi:peroxiredoxin